MPAETVSINALEQVAFRRPAQRGFRMGLRVPLRGGMVTATCTLLQSADLS